MRLRKIVLRKWLTLLLFAYIGWNIYFHKFHNKTSGDYYSFPYAWKGEGQLKGSVTLAYISTPDRLHMLPDIVSHWTGPVSVAVYVQDLWVKHAVQYVTYLRECFPLIKQNIDFHLLVHKNKYVDLQDLMYEAGLGAREPAVSATECDRGPYIESLHFQIQLRKLYGSLSQFHNLPQNHLRNLAAAGIRSPFVLQLDIDILLPQGSFEDLEHFISNLGQDIHMKYAYVVPELRNQSVIRPFHEDFFMFNSMYTNYTRYEMNKGNSELHVSHEVNQTGMTFGYEPFYLAPIKKLPKYEQRFLGYGFTRNTQIFEMLISGWKFKVLTPIFGIEVASHHERPKSWPVETHKNRILFFLLIASEMCYRHQAQQEPLCALVMNGLLKRS